MALVEKGGIIIARKIIESEIWDKPPLYIKVWLYLLLRAQHKQYKGLEKGQLITSIPDIIKDCSWKVGAVRKYPTKDQVYQVIDWMRKESAKATDESNDLTAMITTTKATQKLLVNISNYGLYQDFKNYESNADETPDNEAKATKNDLESDNINKNVSFNKNELKKDLKDIVVQQVELPGFEEPKQAVPVNPKTELIKQVIQYLNQKTGRNYRATTKEFVKLIGGRISDKESPATWEDFKHVIDVKCLEWIDDPKMKSYLTPNTLFNESKFEIYKQQTIAEVKAKKNNSNGQTAKSQQAKNTFNGMKKLFTGGVDIGNNTSTDGGSSIEGSTGLPRLR